MTFLEKLEAAVEKNNSLLCVGLDPDMDKLPAGLREIDSPYFVFNKAIIDATADLVCAFKPNSAFYEARGAAGIEELKLTCDYINETYPEIPVILDFKNGDIGNTNDKYAEFAFDYLGVDAITIQPYEGQKALQSYLNYKEKGVIVLCRMSNEGAGEFQDLELGGKKLYHHVAEAVTKKWNTYGNCLLVVGATQPEEMAEIRQIAGDMVFLVPGVGAQGGDVKATLEAGLRKDGKGLIINSARAIIYASDGEDYADFARAKAIETLNEINKYR